MKDKECPKCDSICTSDEKVVQCSTCKLNFHKVCSRISDLKYEVLNEENSDVYWFCKSCKQTTALMLRQLANVELHLRSIEAERVEEKKEAIVVQKLVNTLHGKIKELESCINEMKETHKQELQSISETVTQMLAQVPQSNSITEKFQQIDGNLDRLNNKANICDTIEGLEERLSVVESCRSTRDTMSYYQGEICPNDLVAEISNEIEERRKRQKSMVIHNLPETGSRSDDFDVVTDIIQYVSEEEREEVKARVVQVYRMGHRHPNRGRTIKVHFNSDDFSEYLLGKSRRLISNVEYKGAVLQKDLTPLERLHLRKLVREKKMRNNQATFNGEEADWIIRGRLLCRKSDLFLEHDN